MSAVAELRREAAATAATEAAASKENLVAMMAPYNHEGAVASDKKQLAEWEQQYTESAVAEASGLPERGRLPDAQAMEKLRAKIAVAPAVKQQLESKKASAALALARAKREAVDAKAALLHEVAIKPALQEFREAFAALGEAGTRLMAAHRQAYPNENDGAWSPSYQALFGPVGELFTTLHGIDWPNPYRYSIRPDWLPSHGRFFPDEMPRMDEAMSEVAAILKEELTA